MCFAVMLGGADGRTLYMVANEWTGSVDVTKPTGRVFSTRVSVPHAGWP
jgi:sugar lactone lactonase YvrE